VARVLERAFSLSTYAIHLTTKRSQTSLTLDLANVARGQEGEVVETDSEKQSVSRIANDGTYNMLWGLGAVNGAFRCECKRSACTEHVLMTTSEYVCLRSRDESVYSPGHDGPLPQAVSSIGFVKSS
jgi:hypothetical protein